MPRAGLSRAAVVDLAVAVVDEGGARGFDTLSLAAVASRAGVAVPSLYKHIGSLADLRREVAVVAVGELTDALTAALTPVDVADIREHAAAPAQDAVARLGLTLRAYAHAHPGRYAATQVAPHPDSPDDEPLRRAAARTVEVVAAALGRSTGGEGGRRDGSLLIHTVRTVRSAVHGFIVLELGGGFGLPENLDASFEHLLATLSGGLRAGRTAT